MVEEKQEAGTGASAKVLQPARAVTLPELRATADLSRKADRRVVQLGLADSRESSSDSDRKDSDMQDRVHKRTTFRTPVRLSSPRKKPKLPAPSCTRGDGHMEIERGLLKWGDSFLRLESRTLYGHLKASITVLFCWDY